MLKNHLLPASLVYLLLLACMALTIQSCTTSSPEEQITEFIESAEKSGENKSLSGLKKLIDKDYNDENGFKREDLLRICAGYFFRNQNIHIQSRIETIQISEKGNMADLTVITAVSDRDIVGDSPELLKADFHRFAAKLLFDGDWRVTSVQWKRVSVDDFLSI